MSEMKLGALVSKAREWMLDDPDSETVEELEQLVAAEDEAALRSRFSQRLTFGTAGLRGAVGAGPNRMNRKVVTQTSAGFASFLLGRAGDADSVSRTVAEPPKVVIGFDARLQSAQFAEDAAQVFAGAGCEVTLLAGPTATPVLAFAVRHLDASAGVMITASHNPPQDNGYKVYLGGDDAGSQIAPPVDAAIAAHIDDAASRPLRYIPQSHDYTVDRGEIRDAYVVATADFVRSTLHGHPVTPGTDALTLAYTAMHGVGFDLVTRVLESADLPNLVSVAEQQQPDGHFPTVNFPNPEEPGALDLAKKLATSIHADLIVAHDPDADRLAIALPRRDGAGSDRTNGSDGNDGTDTAFTQLTGNQVGLLLGWESARLFRQRAGSDAPGALAATVVSSPALGIVATEFGLQFVQTLSGFKWVSRVPNLVFGFEEALGYLVNPEVVRDKDGISAAAFIIGIAQRLRAEGKTLWDRLDEASMRFGHYASDQLVLRLDDIAAVEALSMSIRQQPPTEFGGVAVARFTDFSDPEYGFGGMPVAANVLRFDLVDGSRVMIRPSGTEPKLKMYLDGSCDTGSLDERRSIAESRVAALREAAERLLG